jgi:short-subunit dehydrogenase
VGERGWAVVAGASEGLGEAFARAFAARGQPVVVVARRAEKLEATAAALRAASGVEVRAVPCDLGDAAAVGELAAALAGLDVGTVVYNAALAPQGPFAAARLEVLLAAVDVNVRGPLLLLHALAPGLRARGRGEVVLLSSLAGLQGAPRLAVYAATKAFLVVLAESLWAEWRGAGVNVVVTIAGATRTPGYLRSAGGRDAPGTLDPDQVVAATLRRLGEKRPPPRVVPGAVNTLASWLIGRLLPRRLAIAVMDASTRSLE